MTMDTITEPPARPVPSGTLVIYTDGVERTGTRDRPTARSRRSP